MTADGGNTSPTRQALRIVLLGIALGIVLFGVQLAIAILRA